MRASSWGISIFFREMSKRHGNRRRLVVSKEPNNGSGHLLMSSIHVGEKNLDKAISEAQKAIELDPKNVEAYLQLANLYIVKKDFDPGGKDI